MEFYFSWYFELIRTEQRKCKWDGRLRIDSLKRVFVPFRYTLHFDIQILHIHFGFELNCCSSRQWLLRFLSVWLFKAENEMFFKPVGRFWIFCSAFWIVAYSKDNHEYIKQSFFYSFSSILIFFTTHWQMTTFNINSSTDSRVDWSNKIGYVDHLIFQCFQMR